MVSLRLDPLPFHQQALSCFKLPSFRKAFKWQNGPSSTILESAEEHSPYINVEKLSQNEEENFYCSDEERLSEGEMGR